MQNLIYRGQNFWKVPGKKIPMLHFYPKRKLHETLVVFLTLDKIQLFFFFCWRSFPAIIMTLSSLVVYAIGPRIHLGLSLGETTLTRKQRVLTKTK